jgi:predicted short-subunit dehydrogenase-like oxidoreductase (DUF2520 family)
MHNIVCIGAGKLANQLMPALKLAGFEINQVYSRTIVSANTLAIQLKTVATTDLSQIQKDADFYFFALKDDVLENVVKELGHLENERSLFVHTSGILPLNAIPFKRKGIFYPLQTFSPGHSVEWKTTPILVTGENEEINTRLTTMASKISDLVYKVSDQDRAALHVAAVFANNFTNHMLTLAEKICNEHHVPFEILKPIIRETIEKALDAGPSNSQTGPAVRGDQKTMDKHLNMLEGDPVLQELYLVISKSIMRNAK